jgi:hypothetical protein
VTEVKVGTVKHPENNNNNKILENTNSVE